MTKTGTPLERTKLRTIDLPDSEQSLVDHNQQIAVRQIANNLHRLNRSVVEAVEAGISIELIRTARHHAGDGNWGDLMVPVIVKT
ncbi:MAG: SMc00767 family acetate metabolism repressor [Rhizobiaceae bacterium]